MIRELGLTLVIVGVLSLAIIIGFAGRRSPIPAATILGYDNYVRVFNATTVVVYTYDNPIVLRKIEGQRFELECRGTVSWGLGRTQARPRLVSGRIYLFDNYGDMSRFSLTLTNARDPGEIRKIESQMASRAKYLSEIKEGPSDPYTLALKCRPIRVRSGNYYAVALLEIRGNLTQQAPVTPAPPAPRYFHVGLQTEVYAVISPTTMQVFRALDIALLGLVLIGLHAYYNREEYSVGRAARILRRIYGILRRASS